MAENSKIEWTGHTWSPWEGCTKVSPGCEHCYAEGIYPLNLATDHGHIDDQPDLYRVGKKAAGRLLNGVEHNGFPEVA